jgi:hypothetical protein
MADTHVDEPVPEAPARAHAGRHPGPKEYIRIAIILAAITAAEVAIYYIEGFKEILMHLRFDSRTYARFFVMGLAGAITLFLIVLLTFQVFSS